MIVIPKRRTGSIEAFFGKFPIHQYYVYTTVHAFFTDFTCLSRNRYISFFASVEASTLTQYIFHVYLVVNPKRELDIKVVVTVGLQDNITLETSYAFNLYVYYLRIKLTGFCKHRP